MAGKPRPLLDLMGANYGLECLTCADAGRDLGHDGPGDLSGGGGGTNLTRRQATARAAAHLKANPGHSLAWTALGRAGGDA